MINAKEYDVAALHPVVARTANGNGSGVDIKDYLGVGMLLLDCAAGTGTTPTLDVKLQDSDDNSTFADVSGIAFAQVTTVASQQQIGVNIDSLRRYIRAYYTIGGTTPSFTFSVSFVGRK